jgi:hypothetical protein
MPIPNRPKSQIQYSEQNMGNTSFDEDFGVNAVEIVGFDGTVLRRISIDESGQIQLTNILKILLDVIASPPTTDKSINAIRNTIISGTVDTVTTVTNLTNAGSWNAGQAMFDSSQNTWANMCRSLIT